MQSAIRNPHSAIALFALLGLALAARLFAVALLACEPSAPVVYEHGEIAENLLAGRGFAVTFLGVDGPTSQQAPLFPVMLAACYAVAGIGSPAAILLMQLLQCLAGTAIVACVVWLTRSLAPDVARAPYIAGLLAALYPTHVYMVTHMQVALWATLLLVAMLAVVAEPRWAGGWMSAAVAGVLGGLLLLMEPILVLALPVAAIFLWQRAGATGSLLPVRLRPFNTGGQAARGARHVLRVSDSLHGLTRAACMTLVVLAVIAPWLWRNWQVHGEPVFIKSTFGYAFWQGNNAHSWGTDKIPKPSAAILRAEHDGSLAGMNRALWEARHETLYIDNVLLSRADYAELAAMSEPARCRHLLAQSMQFIAAHPGEYARLCVQRLRYFLLWDETNPKAAHWLYRLASAGWLLLAAGGLALTLPRWRALWPLWGIFALVMVFHTLTIVSARFRIPVEPLGMVWAAPAAALVGQRFIAAVYRWHSQPASAGACVLYTKHSKR